MDMELGIGTNDVDASHIAKGKRTKRLRHLSPCAVTTAISSSSSASEEEHGISGGDCGSFSSTTTTATTLEGTDQEEEDMANCLILLAQGKRGGGEEKNHNNKIREKSMSSRRFSEVTTTSSATAATKIGFFVYECKTCNRTFPSFQALGGHRASHKKPKLTPPEEKKSQPQPQLESSLPVIANCEFEETKQGLVMSTLLPPISLELGGCGGAGANNNNNNNNRGILFHGGNSNSNSNKGKVHECSICGSEFTSGQALGGHMRRHRASTNNTTSAHQDIETASTSYDNKRPSSNNNVLELDLNLPAPPEDDHRDSTFHFTATQNKSIVLSASPALVGCHY